MDKEDMESEEMSEPSSTNMESSDPSHPEPEHGTSSAPSTGLSQDLLDLELVECFPSTSNGPNAQSNESNPPDVPEQNSSEGEEEIDNGSDFESYPDLEFTTPLAYSPGSRDEYESKIELIQIDDDDLPDLVEIQEKLGPMPQLQVQPGPMERKSFQYDGYVHPLLISNVLRDIFNRLDNVNDLRNCRLVSTVWNLEACKSLQKRVTITFLDLQSLETYMSVFPTRRPYHPHGIYQFYNLNLREVSPELQQFLTEFGPAIKTLILQTLDVHFDVLCGILRDYLVNLQSLWIRVIPMPSIQQPVVVEEDGAGPSRLIPQVQQLTIGTRNFNVLLGEESSQRTRRSLVNLLRLLPNLKRISLSSLDNAITPGHCANVLAAILAVGPNRLRLLTKIDFPIEVDEDMLAGLTSLGCEHLNNLEMTINSVVKTLTVADFFQMVGKNTTRLSLSFPASYPYGFQHIRINGQHLRNMRQLRLNRFRWNLGFLEHMLDLEKLVLKDTDVSSLFPRVSMEHKLKVLKIQHEENSTIPPFEAPAFGRITQSFPWLKMLHVPGVNDGCLRSIYFNLPCLTSLELVKGEFTDYGITGVELEVCRDLAETTTYLVVNPDKLRSDLFIGNLTRLKHLRLESSEIGDLSILFGVCKCPLTSLYLVCSNITDFAMEILADQLGHSLKCLNVLHCPEITEAGKYYFKESLSSRKVLAVTESNPDVEKIAERNNMQRHHRYCDAFVRRSLEGSGRSRIENLRRGRFRMYNDDFVNNIPDPNVDPYNPVLPPVEIVDIEEVPIPLQPVDHINEMDYQNELADEDIVLAGEYMEIMGGGHEGGVDDPEGIDDPIM